MEATIKLASSFTHDVADVASLQVLRYRLVTLNTLDSKITCLSVVGILHVLSSVVLDFSICYLVLATQYIANVNDGNNR